MVTSASISDDWIASFHQALVMKHRDLVRRSLLRYSQDFTSTHMQQQLPEWDAACAQDFLQSAQAQLHADEHLLCLQCCLHV